MSAPVTLGWSPLWTATGDPRDQPEEILVWVPCGTCWQQGWILSEGKRWYCPRCLGVGAVVDMRLT